MSSFDRPDLKHTNPEVRIEQLSKSLAEAATAGDNAVEDEIIANKLMDHLLMVRQYQDRNDAIDYLIDNTRNLADTLSFDTNDNEIITAIQNIGGSGKTVTYALYEQALDILDQTFKQMALASLTGVYDDYK